MDGDLDAFPEAPPPSWLEAPPTTGAASEGAEQGLFCAAASGVLTMSAKGEGPKRSRDEKPAASPETAKKPKKG